MGRCLRVDVPVAGIRPEGEQARPELPAHAVLAEAGQAREREPVELLVVAERAPQAGAIRDGRERYRGRQVKAAFPPARVADRGDEALERLGAVEPAVCEEELVQARQDAPRL